MLKRLEFDLTSTIQPAEDIYNGYTKPSREDLNILGALQTTFTDNFKFEKIGEDSFKVSFSGETNDQKKFTRFVTIYGLMSKIRPDGIGIVKITDLDSNEVVNFTLHGGRAIKISKEVIIPNGNETISGCEQGSDLPK